MKSNFCNLLVVEYVHSILSSSCCHTAYHPTFVYRSVPQIRPHFCNLGLSTNRRGGGRLYAGCDIFSRDYALPSGVPPTTSCGGQRIRRLCSCYLEECYLYMWQSRVEIVGYSVAYFDRIAVLEAPYRRTAVKGGAHITCFEYLRSAYEPRESSAIRRFKHSDAFEMHDGITSDFYTGLQHIVVSKNTSARLYAGGVLIREGGVFAGHYHTSPLHPWQGMFL